MTTAPDTRIVFAVRSMSDQLTAIISERRRPCSASSAGMANGSFATSATKTLICSGSSHWRSFGGTCGSVTLGTSYPPNFSAAATIIHAFFSVFGFTLFASALTIACQFVISRTGFFICAVNRFRAMDLYSRIVDGDSTPRLASMYAVTHCSSVCVLLQGRRCPLR